MNIPFFSSKNLARLKAILLLALGYTVCAWVSLPLSPPPDLYATALWPPAGLALAALLSYGRWIWPGVYLGSVILHIFLTYSYINDYFQLLQFSLMVATGSTVQVLIADLMIRHWVGIPNTLSRDKDVFLFLLLGGPVACFIGSILSVNILYHWGATSEQTYLNTWLTWWVGDSIGVLLFSPLFLLWWNNNEVKNNNMRRWQVSLTLSVSFLISYSFFLYASIQEKNSIYRSFIFQVQNIKLEFKNGLDNYINILEALERFVSYAEKPLNNRAFEYFANPFLTQYVGIQALEWIPKIKAEQRLQFESDLQAAGFKSAHITEQNIHGEQKLAEYHQTYYPIQFVVPYRGNEQALGYDISSTPNIPSVLKAAHQTGTAKASMPVRLIQNTDKQFGIVLYKAVYEKDAPESLRGYVAVVLRLNETFLSFLNKLQKNGSLNNFNNFDFVLSDLSEESGEITLFANKQDINNNFHDYRISRYFPEFHQQQLFYIGDRILGLQLYPRDLFFIEHFKKNSWWILIIGLLFTYLTSSFILVVSGRNILFSRLLTERTQELLTAKQSAESANLAKTQFLANMSHEIRTPMNAILGFTEILESLQPDPVQKEYLSIIQTNGKSLLSLLNDILDLSRIEAGKLNLNYTPISIRSICSDLEKIFFHQAQAKGLEFSLHIPEDFPLQINLDEVRLRQILFNLLGNACKFTHEGHVRLNFSYQWLDESKEQLWLIIEVEDSGIGIPEEQQELIFDAFEQQHGQDHAHFGGTGLGLAITHRLVALMKGRIELSSEVNQGSCFRVYLPTQCVCEQIAALKDDEQTLDLSQVQFKAATLLLADGIELNRRLVKASLDAYPFKFIEALNANQLLDLACDQQPDLILLDIKSSDKETYQAAYQLKTQAATQHIPVIAMSALAMKQEERRIRQVCDDYLPKPINRTSLIQSLTKFLPYVLQQAPKFEQPTGHHQKVLLRPVSKALRLKLRQDFMTRWQQLDANATINEIKLFAEQVLLEAREHQCEALSHWAQQLQSQALLFDMPAMLRSLQEFRYFVELPK